MNKIIHVIRVHLSIFWTAGVNAYGIEFNKKMGTVAHLGQDVRWFYNSTTSQLETPTGVDYHRDEVPSHLIPVWVDTQYLKVALGCYCSNTMAALLYSTLPDLTIRPIFVLSAEMAALGEDLATFWCAHEYGHVMQGDSAEDFASGESERVFCIIEGNVVAKELGADAYAVAVTSKALAIKALTSAANIPGTPYMTRAELLNRKVHIEHTF